MENRKRERGERGGGKEQRVALSLHAGIWRGEREGIMTSKSGIIVDHLEQHHTHT